MENLRNYLLENVDVLKGVVAEINAYNGSLDYLEVWENDEFTINELFLNNPYEALRCSYFGYYSIYDSLLRFNAYGNVETLSEAEYKVELQENIDDIIEELLKVYNKIDVSEQIRELIKKML